ncbi:hypothetical protein L345_08522, partial [Ophiophagus hannah]
MEEKLPTVPVLFLVGFELPNCRQPIVSRNGLQYRTLTTAPPRLLYAPLPPIPHPAKQSILSLISISGRKIALDKNTADSAAEQRGTRSEFGLDARRGRMSSNMKGYPPCCNYKGPGTHGERESKIKLNRVGTHRLILCELPGSTLPAKNQIAHVSRLANKDADLEDSCSRISCPLEEEEEGRNPGKEKLMAREEKSWTGKETQEKSCQPLYNVVANYLKKNNPIIDLGSPEGRLSADIYLMCGCCIFTAIGWIFCPREAITYFSASGSPLQNTQRGTEGDIKLNSHQRHPLWKKSVWKEQDVVVGGVNVLVELKTPRGLQVARGPQIHGLQLPRSLLAKTRLFRTQNTEFNTHTP